MTGPDTLPPELAELGELLREEPPRPDPAWARTLDSRAAAGFPRPPRRSPWGILKAHRRVLIPVVSFACVALLVVGLSTADLGSSGDSGGSSVSSEGAGAGAGDSAAGGGASAGGSSASRPSAQSAEDSGATSLSAPKPAPAPGGGSPGIDGRRKRAQERSASLTLAARPSRIEDVANDILRVTDAAGGFVASSTVSGGEASGGSFQLRIPVARLDKAIADLSRLADVRDRTQASRDITAETITARERLREAKREREGLLRALARATTLNETEAVKARLRTVNRELAVARQSVRRVENRAAYANVSVELVPKDGSAAVAPDDGRWTPGDALGDSLRVLEVAAGVAVIVLAVALPLALLAAIAAGGARLAGRRRRERALDMA
jgi:hypothetical protein